MILKEDFMPLTIGNIISYYLRDIDLPKNPHQVWRGRVIEIDQLNRNVVVEILAKGFEGETEYVEWEQVITIELRAPA